MKQVLTLHKTDLQYLRCSIDTLNYVRVSMVVVGYYDASVCHGYLPYSPIPVRMEVYWERMRAVALISDRGMFRLVVESRERSQIHFRPPFYFSGKALPATEFSRR